MLDWVMLRAAQCYAVLQFFAHTYLGINMRGGFGWWLHRLRQPRRLEAKGVRFLFRPAVASSFGRLIAGLWNEPETHVLLGNILTNSRMPVAFIDVGANIGKMVVETSTLDTEFPDAGDAAVVLLMDVEARN